MTWRNDPQVRQWWMDHSVDPQPYSFLQPADLAEIAVAARDRELAHEIEKLPTFTQRGSAGWLRKREVLALLENDRNRTPLRVSPSEEDR